jgi:hypothetical protein
MGDLLARQPRAIQLFFLLLVELNYPTASKKKRREYITICPNRDVTRTAGY